MLLCKIIFVSVKYTNYKWQHHHHHGRRRRHHHLVHIMFPYLITDDRIRIIYMFQPHIAHFDVHTIINTCHLCRCLSTQISQTSTLNNEWGQRTIQYCALEHEGKLCTILYHFPGECVSHPELLQISKYNR